MSEILEWVDVEDLLGATGARNVTRSGREVTFSCFSEHHAHGDSTPSAGMNTETSLWRCRNPACGLRGNAADYLAALKGYTYSEALRVLQERYGGPEISTAPGALEEEVERIRRSYEASEEATRIMLTEDEYLDRFGLHWPLGAGVGDGLPDPMEYMLGRGFAAETLNDWGVGYCDMSDRITIPVYDVDRGLVGIKGRAWDPQVQPRYISIGDKLGSYPRYGFHTYMKSMHVFGLNRIPAGECAIIVEGELNAIAMSQMGLANTVAVAGSEFSQRQCDLIVSRASGVCIYFDGDLAGQAGAAKVAEMLDLYLPISVVPGAAFDAADALDPVKAFTPQILGLLIAAAVPATLSRWTSWLTSS